MELFHYPETDSLYIELKASPSVETRETADGVNADFASEGAVVGIDIDHATRPDLDTLAAVALPRAA